MHHDSVQHDTEMVCSAYGEAIALYSRARAVTDTLFAQINTGETDLSRVEQLQRFLSQAESVQLKVAPLLAAFGTRVPPPVQVVVEKARDLMGEILADVRRAEARAAVVLQELTPQLEVAGRGQQMQRAYSANS